MKSLMTNCFVYLIGMTSANPITSEIYYWIKVGIASNLEKRMKSYATHNPCIVKIDVLENKKHGHSYECSSHVQLEKVCLSMGKNTKEWFQVNKETYLNILKEGFNWFIFSGSAFD